MAMNTVYPQRGEANTSKRKSTPAGFGLPIFIKKGIRPRGTIGSTWDPSNPFARRPNVLPLTLPSSFAQGGWTCSHRWLMAGKRNFPSQRGACPRMPLQDGGMPSNAPHIVPRPKSPLRRGEKFEIKQAKGEHSQRSYSN